MFVGGAFGKLLCGYLGARIGMMKAVWITESATAADPAGGVLPLAGMMAMLPLLGLALNGTSSVLYGVVPERRRRPAQQAFARFRLPSAAGVGAGAVRPAGDVAGVPAALISLAAILLHAAVVVAGAEGAGRLSTSRSRQTIAPIARLC